jgi:hypothetical protein
MVLKSFFALTLLMNIEAPTEPSCEALFVKGEHVPFAELQARLPRVKPKSQYETNAQHDQRLRAANALEPQRVIIVPGSWTDTPNFNAETGELSIYAHNIGINRIDFRKILGKPIGNSKRDYFTGAIGFQLLKLDEQRSTYIAQNDFGANFEVDKIDQHVAAIFEAPGPRGKSPLIGVEKRGPILKLSMSGEQARDLIENGRFALAIVPQAPFQNDGVTHIQPTVLRPVNIEKRVSIIHADIRCAFILDGQNKIVASLSVK